MDMSVYHSDFTQHDLFGLFPGASGGRALRDVYGRVHLITIATKGGRTTLERYGRSICASWLRVAERPSARKKTRSRAMSPTGTALPSGMSPIAHPAVVGAGHASSASF